VKQNDLEDAKQIANLIEEGTATKRDVLSLLMYIRDEISNGMVKDLAHSVAHTSRDRGYAYDQIEHFVTTMIQVFESGGKLEVKPIFPVDKLIKEFCKDLAKLGIQIDRPKTYRNRCALLGVIEELLLGVSLELNNPNIESCVFEGTSDDGPDAFCFVLQTHGLSNGVVTIPPEVRIAFPVFGPIPPTSTSSARKKKR
jgi:hypothetical protein